ncbi:MAG: hypothetical protein PHG39_10955 [Acidithiobacillus ferrooxidans]|nr:hypothetical protein [Acidithiobacillus ferrooxidans]MDD5004050.1 hypothetical protein [Acidithiobacillus sp.]MDD5379793.1 hypothetical protein [Acidithiobacillus sp.]MDD5577029.1 hypothetical protein [Acidithiobacillus sp.]
MPTFFQSKDSLPPELLARWDRAVSEYDRVLREVCGDSETKDLFFYNAIREKSALFWRLLNGKEPLLMPPPTSYSYPWYEIIEEPGPHQVGDIGFRAYGKPLGGELAALRGMDHEDHLFINQCGWTVLSHNAAAQEMLDALQSGDFTLADQNRLMAAGPEWIVQYREWPAYRLFVQRYRRQTLPRFLDDTLRLVDKASWAWTNTVVIGEREDGGVELESDGWFLENRF